MQLDGAEPETTSSVSFLFTAASELLVTNTRNGILPTGIPGTLCKALMLFLLPMIPIGLLLYAKRKRKAQHIA